MGQNREEELLKELEYLKAENQRLKKDQEKFGDYSLILNNLHAGVVIHDSQTRIVYANPAAHRLLGLSSDEMLGKKDIDPHWHFIGSDEKRLPLENYPVNLIIRSMRPIRDYLIGIFRPGQNDEVWVMVNGVPVLDEQTGEFNRIIITFVDVTHQRKYQDEKRLRTIIDTTPLGVCITDENGYFESVNPAYEKLYRYDKGELIGQHFTIVVPDE